MWPLREELRDLDLCLADLDLCLWREEDLDLCLWRDRAGDSELEALEVLVCLLEALEDLERFDREFDLSRLR